MTSERLAELTAALTKAQDAVYNAMDTATKLEQGDWWMEGGKMVVGRHAKAARTRLEKARRERDRLARRVDELKARVG